MVQLDEENGPRCEAPPHGHASEKSVRRFPSELLGFVTRLRDNYGLVVTDLCLGQGLTIFERSIGRSLAKAGFKRVNVYRSATTHASKVQAVGVEAATGLRRNAEGNLVVDGVRIADNPELAGTGPLGV